YIADEYTGRIRKISTSGIITTLAGNGWGYSGDGGDARTAQLNNPFGVAVDNGGNVYVADTMNNAIRRLHPSIEGVNLTVTLEQDIMQLDPTSALPINCTAVFSEAVTGFSAS